jgi:hypothetical protein
MTCTAQACPVADGLHNIVRCHPDRFIHNKHARDGVFYVLTIHEFEFLLNPFPWLIMTQMSDFARKGIPYKIPKT